MIVILDLSDKATFDKTKCFEKVHLWEEIIKSISSLELARTK